ncbi:MAG: DUF935 domain-containing protein [Bacteroidetes bacterium]|nr:DUF935 domain-containing protein [Bacteroidota bacterium]
MSTNNKYKQVIATQYNYYNLTSKILNTFPNPDDVLNKLGNRISEYEKLKYDAHLWSCMQSRKAGVLSLEWEINRGGNKTDAVIIIENIIKELDTYKIFNEMLDAPYLGFKPLEILWQERLGKIIPVDIIGKPNDWFFFDNNKMLRFRKKNQMEGELCPQYKFFIVQHEATYNNPYGDALFAKCYWPVTFKRSIVEFWATFCERFGMPITWANVAEGSTFEECEKLSEELAEMTQDGVIVTPADVKAQFLESSRTGAVTYESFIQFFNAEISKAILSQTLTTEQGDKGTQALGTVHFNVRKEIIDNDKRLIEYWMNELIKWIVKFNFGSLPEIPKFQMYEKQDVDMALAQRDQALASTNQIRFTKNYFKRNYGFQDDEFDVVEPQPATPSFPFAENDDANVETDINQEGLDNGSEIALDDFAKASDKILKPILKLIEDGNSLDEIQAEMLKLFPTLETDAVEELIAKGILIANSGGQLSVNVKSKK